MIIIFTAFLAFPCGIFNKEINKLNPAVLRIKGHRFGHGHHLRFLYLFNIRNQIWCSVLHSASCICQPLWIFPKILSLCRSIWSRIADKIWKFDSIFNNLSKLHSLVISCSWNFRCRAVCPSLFCSPAKLNNSCNSRRVIRNRS